MQFRSLGWEDPWSRKWQPTSVFSPGKFHGRSSLIGYSAWGCKESDMTEHSTHHSNIPFCVCVYIYMYVCMHVYMCIYVYVYMYVCIYMYIYVCIYLYKYHIIFIHSSAKRHLDCFHVLAIVNSAPINIRVHVSFLFFF